MVEADIETESRIKNQEARPDFVQLSARPLPS